MVTRQLEIASESEDDRDTVDEILSAADRGIDLIFGLPPRVTPGTLRVQMLRSADLDAHLLVVNVEFEWDGGSSASFRYDIDEMQAWGQPFFPCPAWGWINWRERVVVVLADHSSCEFAEHQAYRYDISVDTASMGDPRAWVTLARAISDGPNSDGCLAEYDERDSPYSEQAQAISVGSDQKVHLRPELAAPADDAKALLATHARGDDLVIGLVDEPLALAEDAWTDAHLRMLVDGVAHDVEVAVASPAQMRLEVRQVPASGGTQAEFAGWASFPARSPLLLGFENSLDQQVGWVDALRPGPVEDGDWDEEELSPTWLVGIIRSIIRAHHHSTMRSAEGG